MSFTKEIRVLNKSVNTHYYMQVWDDKVTEFFAFFKENRKQVVPSPIPGVCGPASLALSRIFYMVPHQFPLVFLVDWLIENQQDWTGIKEKITFAEMEDALVRWYCKRPACYNCGKESTRICKGCGRLVCDKDFLNYDECCINCAP